MQEVGAREDEVNRESTVETPDRKAMQNLQIDILFIVAHNCKAKCTCKHDTQRQLIFFSVPIVV